MSLPSDFPCLTDLVEAIWLRLGRAAGDSHDPCNTVGLATCDATGTHSRTVVLRQADAADRILLAYTDARSRKVMQIGVDPRASWLFYDPGQRCQIRMRGEANVHSGDQLAEQEWQKTSQRNRKLYGGAAPGTSVEASDETAPRTNFAVIRCVVDYVDWLDLTVPGHRRAQWRWRHEQWTGNWVTP